MVVETCVSLARSTKAVFDICAGTYLQEDRHWLSNADLISNHLSVCRPKAVLDAGCGPGWHLAWLAERVSGEWLIVGLDYSRPMLREAALRVTAVPAKAKMVLRHADIRQQPYADSQFGMVLCLNNAIGNVCPESLNYAAAQRCRILQEINRVLVPNGGLLILSVYNRDALSSEESYGAVFQIERSLSKVDAGDLVVRYCDPPATPSQGLLYYSHWFTRTEIIDLLTEHGFEILSIAVDATHLSLVGRKT